MKGVIYDRYPDYRSCTCIGASGARGPPGPKGECGLTANMVI